MSVIWPWRLEPDRTRAPLSALVAATFGLDLLWPIFLLTGAEAVRVDPGNTAFTPLAFDHYPWTHSLVMAAVWGVVAGIAASSWLKSRLAAFLIGATVVSHWLLDFVTHRPDLPLWPGGPKWGLGLWQSIPGTLFVEGALFVIAIAIYGRASKSRDSIGRWAFWGLVLFTSAIWASGPWSPPPPNASSIAAVGLALCILPIWAGWIDRHRTA